MMNPQRLSIRGLTRYAAAFPDVAEGATDRVPESALRSGALVDDGHRREISTVLDLDDVRSCQGMHQLIRLLEAAMGQLNPQEPALHAALLEVTSLLKMQVSPQAAAGGPDEATGRLLSWQARKVRDYIDTHIAGPVTVADLCRLIQRSEAHFSRSFRRTFGASPYAFVIRRRVELAARCMLQTGWSLCDIALRFGFTDQAHLCKRFRQITGQTPAAWRRARTAHTDYSPARRWQDGGAETQEAVPLA
jgi:AraC family transcriptional regulator